MLCRSVHCPTAALHAGLRCGPLPGPHAPRPSAAAALCLHACCRRPRSKACSCSACLPATSSSACLLARARRPLLPPPHPGLPLAGRWAPAPSTPTATGWAWPSACHGEAPRLGCGVVRRGHARMCRLPEGRSPMSPPTHPPTPHPHTHTHTPTHHHQHTTTTTHTCTHTYTHLRPCPCPPPAPAAP